MYSLIMGDRKIKLVFHISQTPLLKNQPINFYGNLSFTLTKFATLMSLMSLFVPPRIFRHISPGEKKAL